MFGRDSPQGPACVCAIRSKNIDAQKGHTTSRYQSVQSGYYVHPIQCPPCHIRLLRAVDVETSAGMSDGHKLAKKTTSSRQFLTIQAHVCPAQCKSSHGENLVRIAPSRCNYCSIQHRAQCVACLLAFSESKQTNRNKQKDSVREPCKPLQEHWRSVFIARAGVILIC